MKLRPLFFHACMAMALTASIAAQSAPKEPPATGAAGKDTGARPPVIDLPRQTLTFKPSRDDMTVGKAIVSIYCSDPDNVRINGIKPDPRWSDVHFKDGEIVVDSRNPGTTGHAWLYVELPRVAKNQFDLARLKIEVVDGKPGGMICMSVKVWFKEVTNQYDSLFYEKTDDRYALVSYCTSPPEQSEVKSRFRQNRVATAAEFKDILTRPFVIKLKSTALREEWSK